MNTNVLFAFFVAGSMFFFVGLKKACQFPKHYSSRFRKAPIVLIVSGAILFNLGIFIIVYQPFSPEAILDLAGSLFSGGLVIFLWAVSELVWEFCQEKRITCWREIGFIACNGGVLITLAAYLILKYF